MNIYMKMMMMMMMSDNVDGGNMGGIFYISTTTLKIVTVCSFRIFGIKRYEACVLFTHYILVVL